MAGLNDSAFSRVLSAFRSRLSAQDRADFELTTFKDLQIAIDEIQKAQAQRRGIRNLNKIRPFLNGLQQYSKVIEVFVNAKPDLMAFIWGPIKLCLQFASNLADAFDALLDAYEKIGKSLPIFSKIDDLFLSHSYVQQVLVDVYEDILDFHKRAVVFFRQGAWKLVFKMTVHTFGDMFGDVIKKLERSKELLLQSASIAHFQAAQESRLLFTQQFKAQTEQRQHDRKLAVINWLSPVSCSVDHEELQRKRQEFPTATQWLFKEDSLRHWLQQSGGSDSTFWILGIPGAGKTFLFSSLIDYIKKTYIEASVVFFYCKYRDPLKKTLDGVARSLIQQLLQFNPVSLDFLYEVAVTSGEEHPSSFGTYKNILKHIASAHDQLYIGIDGLDECEQEDRRLILLLLRHILDESSPNATIKIFLASRWMKEIEDSLKSVLRFKIKDQHIRHDIRDYVHIRTGRLGEKFGLNLERQKSISTEICHRSEGMFLLARLIIDNLISQINLEDLEHELRTDILPTGIKEAYGRILVRIGQEDRKIILRILELIIVARYPLKTHEIQGALSIRLEDMSVNFEGRRLHISFTELCGPILEVHADDSVSLVHPTARQYLIQKHSGPFVDEKASELRMANLCIKYLTFECFSSLQKSDNRDLAAFGAYAFQEYATINWICHLERALDHGMRDKDEEFIGPTHPYFVLQSRHDEIPLQEAESLDSKTIQKQPQALRAGLARLRTAYDAVSSIAQGEDGEAHPPLPYSLRLLAQVRSIIEAISPTGSRECAIFTQAYGESIFKCPIIECPGFLDGYKTRDLREKHIISHQSRFECTFEECESSTFGFPTLHALAKHMKEHGPPPDKISFPQVQRCSLQKSLHAAIDKDDAMAIRSLCIDASASSLTTFGLLDRAVRRKSHKAAEALLQLLPTAILHDHTVESKHRLARELMVIAATNNNQTLTRLAMNIITSLEPTRVRSSNLIRPLQESAWHGHRGIVTLLLDEYHPYQNLDFAEHQNFKAFALAARAGHEEIVILLLDKYRDVILRHPDYFNVIRTAGLEKNMSIARLLLKRSWELNDLVYFPDDIRELVERGGYEEILEHLMRPDSGRLHLAASEGDLQEVRRLLELGASIHEVFGDHGTALAAAAGEGQLACIKYLVDKGAEINSNTGFRGELPSPLERAIIGHHPAAAEFLLQEGARVSDSSLVRALQEFGMPFVKQLIKWGAQNSPQEQPFGGDLLRAVAGLNQAEIPEILILLMKEGASLNSTTGLLALHEAVRRGCETNVKVLLESKADVNFRDGHNFTPLQLAAGLDRPDILSHLLKAGADVSIVGTGESALLIAVRHGNAQNVKLLLQWKAKVDWGDLKRGTPLQVAADFDRPEILTLLLEAGAKVNYDLVNLDSTFSMDLGTPLLIAVKRGHEQNVKLLLKWGARVDVVHSLHGTPLHLAASLDKLEILKLLLEADANVNRSVENIDTSLQTAATLDRPNILRNLIEAGVLL